MSLHDKTLFLFNNAALAKAATTSITSKLIDLRYNGGLDDNVYVKASLGASATDGYVTFTLQTSYDGSSWVTLISKTNVGATLFEGRLPKGCRRYLKSTVTVGTALAAATTVHGLGALRPLRPRRHGRHDLQDEARLHRARRLVPEHDHRVPPGTLRHRRH